MCERYYGGIKEVDMRDRKELKTTLRFFILPDQEAKCVAIAPTRDAREMQVGQQDDRQVGGGWDREKIIQLWHVKFEMLEGVLVEMSSTCFQF